MADPTNLSEIDLTPIPGKIYFNLEREWREEFIYFALIDRFHDDQVRTPVLQPGRSNGISAPNDFFGGKIKGITNHLDYIAGTGLYRHLGVADLREQRPRLSRLRH